MKVGRRGRWSVAAIGLVLASAGLPAQARSQTQGGPTSALDGKWHFTVAPYLWASGIKGDVSVANLPSIPVDASFSDLWDDLDFALDAHFEGRKDRFGFGLDMVYSNLGVPVAPDAPILDYEVDVRQLFSEGFVFYRAASGGRADNPAHLDLLLGARYTGTKTRLSAQSAADVEYDGAFRELSWVDALAGLRFRAPLGSRAAILGRADVAGFGSKLTWNLEGDLAVRASEHWTLGAGWRHMDIEYDEGEGIERKQFDLAYDGPRFWFAYSW